MINETLIRDRECAYAGSKGTANLTSAFAMLRAFVQSLGQHPILQRLDWISIYEGDPDLRVYLRKPDGHEWRVEVRPRLGKIEVESCLSAGIWFSSNDARFAAEFFVRIVEVEKTLASLAR